MLNNNFANAPTVGSHDYDPAIEELQARIERLELRLSHVEEEFSAKAEKRPSKIKWKKVKKVFNTFIKPVLDFIPKFINAICRFKELVRA